MNNFLNVALSLSALHFTDTSSHIPHIPPRPSRELVPESIQILQKPNQWTQVEHFSNEFILQFYNQLALDLMESEKWNNMVYSSIQELIPGDLLLFGLSEDDIQMLGVYLGNDQLMLLVSHQHTSNIRLSSLSDLQWKNAFPFHTALRFNPNEISKEEIRAENRGAATEVVLFDAGLGDQFQSYYINEEKTPLVISCKDYYAPFSSIQGWIEGHQPILKSLLENNGTLLLRDFPVENANNFATFVEAILKRKLIDYRGGEGSRKKVVEGVYTSTEAPPKIHIPLHNEFSCTVFPLDYICFYCDIASEPGTGQTILGKTVAVHEEILKRPHIWNFFNGQKIRYISRHPPKGSFFSKINKTHKTWPEVFETDDREEVERICQKKGFKYRWLGDWIEVVRIAPAIRDPDRFFDHPYWFNQAYLYHGNPRLRGGWLNHLLANLLYMIPTTRQYDVELEDGTPIPKEIVYEIYDILNEKTIKFDWKKGDVLILDNIRTMHGRASYNSQRRILVAMVPQSLDDETEEENVSSFPKKMVQMIPNDESVEQASDRLDRASVEEEIFQQEPEDRAIRTRSENERTREFQQVNAA